MNRKLMLLIAFLSMNTSVYAQAIGGDEHQDYHDEQASQPRIVTRNCNEAISKVMGEMIKYYIDRGDFESASALTQVAKKYQIAHMNKPNNMAKPNHAARPKEENVPWTYNDFKRWIFGYF